MGVIELEPFSSSFFFIFQYFISNENLSEKSELTYSLLMIHKIKMAEKHKMFFNYHMN